MPNQQRARPGIKCVTLCVLLTSTALAGQATPVRLDQPDPAALISNARRQADWVFETRSLVLKSRIKTTRSAAEVRRAKSRLRNEMREYRPEQPTVTKKDIEERPSMSRSNQAFETVVWDQKNYCFHFRCGLHETIVTWDGVEGRRVYKKPSGVHEWYRRPGKAIGDGEWFGYLWSSIGEDWRPLPVFDHPSIDALRQRRLEHAGRPQDFIYMGVIEFHGKQAHMLRNPNGLGGAALIDTKTGRFCGMVDGTWRAHVDGTWERTVAEHFESVGQRGSLRELAVRLRWKAGRGKHYDACLRKFRAKVSAMDKAGRPEDYKPLREFVFEAELEVQPGKWFPMRQRRIEYEAKTPRDIVKLEEHRTVFRLELNEPIEDKSVFKLEIPDVAQDVRMILK